MAFEPERVDTITVDSYGTLVDPSAAEKALKQHVDNPRRVSGLWRTRSLMYSMVSNFIEQYQTFWEMIRDALDYALSVQGIELKDSERDRILSVYHELRVFKDVRTGLQTLTREWGYPVYVLSNGNPEMLESMVVHAEIEVFVEDTISADEIRTFKPHPDIYRHASKRTDTPIQRILHVSGPGFDVQGAMHAGMQGCWLNRNDAPFETYGPKPDIEVSSFNELVEKLAL